MILKLYIFSFFSIQDAIDAIRRNVGQNIDTVSKQYRPNKNQKLQEPNALVIQVEKANDG